MNNWGSEIDPSGYSGEGRLEVARVEVVRPVRRGDGDPDQALAGDEEK